MQQRASVPLWFKLSYTLMAVIVVSVYSYELPLSHFLWFSDIALITLVIAVWLNNRLLSSCMAVGVLFLELGWVADFLTGGNLLGAAAYVFDADRKLHLNILSAVFHLALPPVLIYLLLRWGYDTRAFLTQSLIALVVMTATYFTGAPQANTNWAFGIGGPQDIVHPFVYLVFACTVLIVMVYWPSHLIFKRFFDRKREAGGSRE